MWEYKITSRSNRASFELKNSFEQMGLENWEFVCSDARYFYWKRPKLITPTVTEQPVKRKRGRPRKSA